MKNQNIKITVNVAIAAYNAEKNINRLVTSMLNQRGQSYILKKVIVNSDSSIDRTVPIAKKIKDKRVTVIDSNARAGFAGALVNLVNKNDADILIILNDDIIITDNLFLEKIIPYFVKEKNIGLVSCNIQPFSSNNFVSRSAESGFVAYKKMAESFKNGNNIFTCDGKVLCFSKEFIRSLHFPNDKSTMGNVDSYLYLSCIKNNFSYRYAKEASVFFKLPNTMSDFVKWQIRNYTSDTVMKKTFGNIAEREFLIPVIIFNKYKFIEFLKNPLGSIFILFIGFYCSYKAVIAKNEFNLKWDLVQTTKDL